MIAFFFFLRDCKLLKVKAGLDLVFISGVYIGTQQNAVKLFSGSFPFELPLSLSLFHEALKSLGTMRTS